MCAATLTSIHTCCALSPCVRVCDGHTHTHTHSGPASYKTYKVALYQQCVQFMVWFLLAAAQTLLPSLPVSVSHSSPLLLPLSRSLSLSPAAFLSLPLSSPVFFYYFLLLAADALRQSAVNPSSTHNPYTTPLPLPEPPPLPPVRPPPGSDLAAPSASICHVHRATQKDKRTKISS